MKTLDFNAVSRPVLTLVMKDKDMTKIRVTTPTAALVDKLRASLPALQEVMSKSDAETSRAVFSLAAELISCNLDGISVDADKLVGVYEMNLSDLIVFYGAYEEFITGIEEAKN